MQQIVIKAFKGFCMAHGVSLKSILNMFFLLCPDSFQFFCLVLIQTSVQTMIGSTANIDCLEWDHWNTSPRGNEVTEDIHCWARAESKRKRMPFPSWTPISRFNEHCPPSTWCLLNQYGFPLTNFSFVCIHIRTLNRLLCVRWKDGHTGTDREICFQKRTQI